MKLQAHLVLIALISGACLTACNKKAETETANTTAPPAAADDTAANTSGTTTYYGTPEEQQPQTPQE